MEYDDKAIAIFIFADALDVAISPSGCAKQCIADGLRPHGKATCVPNISTLVSTFDTFRRTRGRILYRSYEETFSRRLVGLC